MNKEAFLQGYAHNPSTSSVQWVVLGAMAKEAGIHIPQEEIDKVLNRPLEKCAGEHSIDITPLFLSGYTMDKEAISKSTGYEYPGGWLNPFNIPGKVYNLGVGQVATDWDMARINRGEKPRWTGASQKFVEYAPMAIPGVGTGAAITTPGLLAMNEAAEAALKKGINIPATTKEELIAARGEKELGTARSGKAAPWYYKLWDWLKQPKNLAMTGAGLGGAYLLYKALSGKRQPPRQQYYPQPYY